MPATFLKADALSAFRHLAWLIGIIYATIPCYWFLVHPFASRWQGWKKSPFRILLPLWILIILAIAAATWPWRAHIFYRPSTISWTLAAVLFVAGFLVYRQIGRFGIARFAGFAELRPREHEQQLIVTGLHGHVRHPIYLAHLCMLLAWAVSSGLLILYLLLPVAIFLGAVMIHLEERELRQRFGEAYREYSQHTPAILPIRFR